MSFSTSTPDFSTSSLATLFSQAFASTPIFVSHKALLIAQIAGLRSRTFTVARYVI
jgi:hypothetical protein